jgi:hypothetical protein
VVRRWLVLTVLAALVLGGCSTVDSADIRTSGITADLTVTVLEGSTSAEVSGTLRVGTLTFVELGGGEKFTASGGGQSAVLKRRKVAGVTSYYGRLEGVSAPGTEITFALQREGDNGSAPTSTVTLPEPVQFGRPAPGTRFSRRANLPVRFLSGPPAELAWAGHCIQPGSLQIEAGRTTATISRGSIQATTTSPSPGGTTSDTCQISLTLTRRTEGKLDGAFKDGFVTAESRSVRQVVSAP